MSQHIGYSANARMRWTEVLPWVFSALVYYYLPEYLSLGARVLIYILFALSLDLIVGYSGIITLGHAAFFGVGAYTCGILSVRFHLTDPVLSLFIREISSQQ